MHTKVIIQNEAFILTQPSVQPSVKCVSTFSHIQQYTHFVPLQTGHVYATSAMSEYNVNKFLTRQLTTNVQQFMY